MGLFILLGVAGFLFLRMAGSGSVAVMGTIKQRGLLRVGVQEEIAPYGGLDTNGRRYGFEIDLAQAIGQQLLGSDAVDFVGLQRKTAKAYLDDGQIDCLIAMVPINKVNAAKYAFAGPYAVDPVQFLVQKGYAFHMGTPDIRIGVITGANIVSDTAGSPHAMLLDYCRRQGFTAEEIERRVLEMPSYQEAMEALSRGDIQAFCGEQSLLHTLNGNNTELAGPAIGEMRYGIACRKLNSDLAKALQSALMELEQQGVLAALLQTHGLNLPGMEQLP